MMDTKKATDFLNNNLISFANINLLPNDASNRRYFRVITENTSYILMADNNTENLAQFIKIDDFLCKNHFFAPKIINADLKKGFALIQDFEDETFTNILKNNPDAEKNLYLKATNELIKLNGIPHPDFIPQFSVPELNLRALLFIDHFAPNKAYKSQIDEEFSKLIPEAFEAVPLTVALRDVHADNLMLINNGKDIGLLDFQDARIAPMGFDLMCLLEDARRDVDPEVILECRKIFLTETKADKEAFDFAWSVMAAQRHLKEVGLFAKFGGHYKKHIPRILKNIEKTLEHPKLKDLKKWIQKSLMQ